MEDAEAVRVSVASGEMRWSPPGIVVRAEGRGGTELVQDAEAVRISVGSGDPRDGVAAGVPHHSGGSRGQVFEARFEAVRSPPLYGGDHLGRQRECILIESRSFRRRLHRK